jgi:hypothetical protein
MDLPEVLPEPRVSSVETVCLIVKVTKTDPPPGWQDKLLHTHQRECELMYGPNAQVGIYRVAGDADEMAREEIRVRNAS